MAATPEQQARDLLDRLGYPDAQSLTSGDVVELANMFAAAERAAAERKLFGRYIAYVEHREGTDFIHEADSRFIRYFDPADRQRLLELQRDGE